jgi:uncharacterized protein (TIGR02246 family)
MDSTGSDRDRRFQDLADRSEIERLLVDYGRYLDAGNFDAFAELFAENAELLLGPGMRASGREEIRLMMSTRLQYRVGKVFHLITSPVVLIDGDRATAETMWTVAVDDAAQPGRIAVTGLGRHRDDLVRDEGRWVIRRRRGYQDLPSVSSLPE